jgi:hypothetical protein
MIKTMFDPYPAGTLSPKGQNYFLTNCKLCRGGVYKGEAIIWLTRPMGISHGPCAVEAGLAKEDQWVSSAPLAVKRTARPKVTKSAPGKGNATASTASGEPPMGALGAHREAA